MLRRFYHSFENHNPIATTFCLRKRMEEQHHHKYLLHVLRIAKHADLHLGARDVGQLHGATETLVLLRVVVLEADLELDGLCELPVLLPGL